MRLVGDCTVLERTMDAPPQLLLALTGSWGKRRDDDRRRESRVNQNASFNCCQPINSLSDFFPLTIFSFGQYSPHNSLSQFLWGRNSRPTLLLILDLLAQIGATHQREQGDMIHLSVPKKYMIHLRLFF